MILESTEEIRRLVLSERNKAVSDREWRHRVRGYGYAIRDDAEGLFTSLRLGAG